MADLFLPMAFTAPIDGARRFWIAAASVAGGAGLVASAVPFVASLAPSDRARARGRALGAPVAVDLRDMQLGELRTVEWRGKPAVFADAQTLAGRRHSMSAAQQTPTLAHLENS